MVSTKSMSVHWVIEVCVFQRIWVPRSQIFCLCQQVGEQAPSSNHESLPEFAEFASYALEYCTKCRDVAATDKLNQIGDIITQANVHKLR